MAEFTRRVGLGRPLTYEEADENFEFVEEQADRSAQAALDAELARDDAQEAMGGKLDAHFDPFPENPNEPTYDVKWSPVGALEVTTSTNPEYAGVIGPQSILVREGTHTAVVVSSKYLQFINTQGYYGINGGTLRYSGPYAITHAQDLTHKAYVDELMQSIAGLDEGVATASDIILAIRGAL